MLLSETNVPPLTIQFLDEAKVTTHNDDGSIIESVVLNPAEDRYGVNIPKYVWHTIQSLKSNSVIFEVKEGPFVPHEEEGVYAFNLNVNDNFNL